MMAIARDEVEKIADLANLHFSDMDIEEFTRQFQRILDYIDKLSEVDIEGIEPTSHVSLTKDFEKHIFREDEVRESLPADESLANAPDPGHGHFRVPKVL